MYGHIVWKILMNCPYMHLSPCQTERTIFLPTEFPVKLAVNIQRSCRAVDEPHCIRQKEYI